jgi:hypothetical protein
MISIAIVSDRNAAPHKPAAGEETDPLGVQVHGRNGAFYELGSRAKVVRWYERTGLAIQVNAFNAPADEAIAVAKGLTEQ